MLLGVWIVYPTRYTIARSFFGQGFGDFVGIDNYKTLFSTDILVKAIKNSAIWILVAPAIVTAIGLVFAVLTERIRWSVAFKTVVFMPMAISLFATGVIWRMMYSKDPSQGAVNAGDRRVLSCSSAGRALGRAAVDDDADRHRRRRATCSQAPSARAASRSSA